MPLSNTVMSSKLHSWDVSAKEAIEIQKHLRAKLSLNSGPGVIRRVAGADVSFSKRTDDVWAGVVVFSYPGLLRMEERWVKGKTKFPYVPGLLSFREIPLLLQVFQNLDITPDLIFCDGQGIAHPRGLGIASHLGLLLDRPAIGCAKSRLVGTSSDVGEERGSFSPLRYEGKTVGGVLRTRTRVKPLFISPGNKITVEESLKMVLDCCPKYRMPEPTRQAHILVNRIRRMEE